MSKIPELTEQFLAAADIEAETQIGIGPITHIPANDWAAIGARLERAIGGGLVVELSPTQGRGFWAWVGVLENGGEMTGVANNPGKSLLEALTAALDAAEGKQQ